MTNKLAENIVHQLSTDATIVSKGNGEVAFADSSRFTFARYSFGEISMMVPSCLQDRVLWLSSRILIAVVVLTAAFEVPAESATIASFQSASATAIANVDEGIPRAQSFVAGFSGPVGTVSVFLSELSGTPSAVTVELVTTNVSGFPDSTLGTVQILSPSVSTTPSFFVADFSPFSIGLVGGEEYAIKVSVDSPDRVRWNFESSDAYSGGRFMTSSNGGTTWSIINSGHADAPFIVESSIPTPSSALGMAFVGSMILVRRRRG